MKKLILWDLDGTLIDSLEDLGEAVNKALGLRALPLLQKEDFRKMVGHGVRNLVKQALETAAARVPGAAAPGAHATPGTAAPESPATPGAAAAGAHATPGAAAPESPATPFSDAEIDAALADFKAYYSAHIDVHTRPYPGMPELLGELAAAGVKMAVVSNKFQEGTERLIKEFFPGIDFVAILGNGPGRPLKPSPEIVEEVLLKAAAVEAGSAPESVDRADALLVGDSPTDMRTAANGGIASIAVTWGYRSREELASALAETAALAAPAAHALPIADSVEELRSLISAS